VNTRLLSAAALLVGAYSLTSIAQSGTSQVVEDAAKALGGRDRILAIKTLTIKGEGTSGALTQSIGATGKMSLSSLLGFTQTIDLANQRMGTQYSTKRQFAFVLPEPGPVNARLDGDVAYNVGPDGTARAGGNARDRQIEMLRHPITAVRAALDPAAKVSPARRVGNTDVVDITTARGQVFSLAVARDTRLPVSVSNMTFNNILGDVAVTTTFSGYEEINGVKLPKLIRTTVDDKYKYLDREIKVATNTLDADASDLAAPASAKAAPAAPAGGGAPPAPPPVVVKELAKGIYHLGGMEAAGGFQYNMIMVEFADHSELIEPIVGEARTLQVIKAAKAIKPEKPITRMIVTHSHSDHAGGARAAVSEGLTLVVHESTRAYFDDIINRPFKSRPDVLAKSGVKPKPTVGVKDHLRVKDATQTMDIYYFPTNAHADHMMFVHFPEHGIAVDGDMYNMDPGPGRPAPDIWPSNIKTGVIAGFNLVWIDNFFREIERRKLNVTLHVPIHGVPVTHERLKKFRAEWNAEGTARLDEAKN
jgi:glyoxylase-like metal-dependent hydrolase (beta-lactamase superfamily II)